MKIKLHIPTEQYGFVEVEAEANSVEEAIEAYKATKSPELPDVASLGANGGLDTKEWQRTLDGYLSLGTMPSDVYERMSVNQKQFVQEIKRAFKRIKQ